MGMMSLTDHALVQKVRSRVERHGWVNTLHFACMRLINVVLPLRILRGLHAETVDLSFLACPRRYRGGFAASEALAGFSQDPEAQLSPHFVAQALRAGDECYALCEGERVASYGWCSTHPTPVGTAELVLHFSPDYAYCYKCFTAVRHRGQRLHAIAMTRTLRHYRSKGYRGLLCYVESTNFDSLKSYRRMGYKAFGSIVLLRAFGRYFAFSTPGCKRFDFRIEHAAPPAASGENCGFRAAALLRPASGGPRRAR